MKTNNFVELATEGRQLMSELFYDSIPEIAKAKTNRDFCLSFRNWLIWMSENDPEPLMISINYADNIKQLQAWSDKVSLAQG